MLAVCLVCFYFLQKTCRKTFVLFLLQFVAQYAGVAYNQSTTMKRAFIWWPYSKLSRSQREISCCILPILPI